MGGSLSATISVIFVAFVGIIKILKFGNNEVVGRFDILFPAFITETQISGMPGPQFVWMAFQN